MDKVDVLGIPVDGVDRPQLLGEISRLVGERRVALVNNVNVHACNLAVKDAEFMRILQTSELVFCDGYGVKWCAAMFGKKLGQRLTPPDWIDDLFKLCCRKSYRVYFIGDTLGVVSRFATHVQARYPSLRIMGVHDGFFEPGSVDEAKNFCEIARLKPDIILTAMGMPRQEKWAERARSQLEFGVIIATGALFRWYTKTDKRAPAWVTQNGLEWLARLIQSPRRHFKRYVIGLPLFFFRMLTQGLRK
jgi:N-acetylglucosaminyldiphosphoundecaprenol N-acetyl-beta-D-mannosaminyltransferase